MMHRRLGWTALLALAIIAPATTAQGQLYYYPQGYGGWYGWGGGETVLGANARGMGLFAAGVGAYNLDTSQARSINIDTNMRLNEYIWESQQIRNRQYWTRQAERRQQNIADTQKIYERLRNNPEARDIRTGDALNVALDEVTDPKVYLASLKEAGVPIASQTVKNIPFQYAPEAITISLSELTREGVPEVLKTNPQLEAERQAARAAIDKARKQADSQGKIDLETLREVQAAVKALHAKTEEVLPQGPERREAHNFLKALYGLTKMLEQPDVDRFLKELDKVETTTLGHLINFMQAFNLRFGVARTPAQQAAYTELYPKLDALRDEVNPKGSNPMVADLTPEDHAKALQAFSGMEFDDFGPQPPVQPEGSAPGTPGSGKPE